MGLERKFKGKARICGISFEIPGEGKGIVSGRRRKGRFVGGHSRSVRSSGKKMLYTNNVAGKSRMFVSLSRSLMFGKIQRGKSSVAQVLQQTSICHLSTRRKSADFATLFLDDCAFQPQTALPLPPTHATAAAARGQSLKIVHVSREMLPHVLTGLWRTKARLEICPPFDFPLETRLLDPPLFLGTKTCKATFVRRVRQLARTFGSNVNTNPR